METEKTLLTLISKSELKELFNEALTNQLNSLVDKITNNSRSDKEFLSRKETAEFFDVSLVTIHSWINNGLIIPLKMGNKTYFKKSCLVEKLMSSNKRAA
jgi:hypothetical protein